MAAARKKQQWIIFGGIGAGVLVVLAGANMVMNQSSSSLVLRSEVAQTDSTIIADRTSHASPEMSWITTSSQEIERLNKELGRIKTERATDQANAELAREELMDEFSEVLVTMQAEINGLKAVPNASAQQRPDTNLIPAALPVTPGRPGEGFATSDFITRNNGSSRTERPLTGGRQTGARAIDARTGELLSEEESLRRTFGVEFVLSAKVEDAAAPARRKKIGSYLPAGSYAPAVVISGVDASTGVVSQDNPVPVSLRITGPATTAGDGTTRGAKINLKGCMVLGSARGDLSSERVYVRLDKLTCIKGDTVIETDVAGYMSGSGKAGVRGPVVSREGNLVAKAGIAGALEGLAGAFEGAQQSVATAEGASVTDILKSAGTASIAGGTANAASTLADYYIQRAEQYQPVISLYGGSKVEIVFLEGVDLSLNQ